MRSRQPIENARLSLWKRNCSSAVGITEDLDGQRLNVRQLRCRPTAPQTGLPEYLSHDVFDHAVQPDQVAVHAPQGSEALAKVPHLPIPRGRLFGVTQSPS